jgi:hypothetical protein
MSKQSREAIKENVLNAFQDAEEMGGVEDYNEYALLIGELMAEFSKRLQTAIINSQQVED